MAFINKAKVEIFKRPKELEGATYTGSKFPSVRDPSMTSVLMFNVIDYQKKRFDRDRTGLFANGTKYLDIIQMPMVNITESLQNEYSEGEIGMVSSISAGADVVDSAVAVATGAIRKQVKGMLGAGVADAMGSKSISSISSLFYDKTQTRKFSFTFSLFPKRPQDSKNLAEIINKFRRYMLPTASGTLLYFPKLWVIEEKIVDKHEQANRISSRLMLGPCALIDVNTDKSPQRVERKLANGDPVQVDITLTFNEIYQLDSNDIKRGM